MAFKNMKKTKSATAAQQEACILMGGSHGAGRRYRRAKVTKDDKSHGQTHAFHAECHLLHRLHG